MANLKYLALAAALALSAPAFSTLARADTVIDTHDATLTSRGALWNAHSYDLSDGLYALTVIVSGSNLRALEAHSYIWETLDKPGGGGTYLRTVANFLKLFNTTGPLSYSTTFNVTDGASKSYQWFFGTSTLLGSATFSTTLTKIASVPGPEAGTGLAGLAMAAIGFWAYRRGQKAAV